MKRILLAVLACGVCTGVSCRMGGDTYISLDNADARITITQSAGSADANAVASITRLGGAVVVVLEEGQGVAINGQSLTGPDASGVYARTIPAAETYTIRVSEPTRGVDETTAASPAAFEITSPAAGGTASLAGFAVAWSGADPGLTTAVRITQVIQNQERRKTFGPFTDTGGLTLSHTDLVDFGQGVSMLIEVMKIREQTGIAGFRSGTIRMERSRAVTVQPGP